MPRSVGRIPSIAVALGVLLSLSGCVERRYTIRTDPPGALVIVNDQEIGTSPVSSSYTYYGARNVRILREGYETMDVVEDMRAPWFDNVLTEFFTENLLPITLRDEREFTYKLKEIEPEAPSELINQAEALRGQGQAIPPQRRGGIRGFFGF